MKKFKYLFLCSLLLSMPLQAVEILPGDNQPMPPIRWQDDNGRTYDLSESRGQPRLIHFWAAWCIPCRKEMPEMLQWRQQNPDIKLIALSLDQRIAQPRYFINKYQLAMTPLLLNEEDGDRLGIPVVPYTLLISADDRIVGHFHGAGAWTEETFSRQLRQRLGI